MKGASDQNGTLINRILIESYLNGGLRLRLPTGLGFRVEG